MLIAALFVLRTQMSYNKWKDKQILEYSYKGILLSNKSEQTIDVCSNIGESKWLNRVSKKMIKPSK